MQFRSGHSTLCDIFSSQMERLEPLQKDYYCVEEAGTDGEYSSSSEDEVEEYFAKLAGVSSRSVKHGGVITAAEQRDQFESDMDKELNEAFNIHKSSIGRNIQQIESTPTLEGPTKSNEVVDPALGLDDGETNSDEEFSQEEKLSKPSNEELFYDPEEDQRDQEWVDNERRSHRPTGSGPKPSSNSDAVLNCPCCMALLCLDCQRHSVYKTQYRAMFVSNCRIKQEQRLMPPNRQMRQQSRKRKADVNGSIGSLPQSEVVSSEDSEIFHPVVCSVCNTEVAVQDRDEVYHFFNVLSSYT